MDPLQAVLAPMLEIGTDISASVYKMPVGVKGELILGIVGQEPRLKSLVNSRQAKVMGAGALDGKGEFLIAIGGYVPPEVFQHVHGVLMSIDGTAFIVGSGPNCAGLPATDFGRAAVGAHARSMASSSKPWWKVW